MAESTNGFGEHLSVASHRQQASLLDPENERQTNIINIIDQLRALKIDRAIPLPQLIVCGAQSSGKSSVLGAITEVPFPSGEQTCTRYVTKVTLECAEKESVIVTIDPGEDRNTADQDKLRGFSKRKDISGRGPRQILHEYIQEANELIFSGNDDKQTITDDVLCIKITGPDKRALQLVDLPGLIGWDRTRKNIDDKIREIVRSYMAMKQSTILAVVPSSNDIDNADILKLCDEFDPGGDRTLGIITKPDLAQNPDTIVDIMEGNVASLCEFKWHLMPNLGSDPTGEKDAEDGRMSEQRLWDRISPNQRGIQNLRSRLREMYFSAAERELPKLEEKVLGKLREDRFKRLAEEPQPRDLHEAFKKATQRLQKAAQEQAKGTYAYVTNQFDHESPVLLRSRVEEQNDQFRDEMNAKGHSWRSHAGMPPLDPNKDAMPPTPPSDSQSHLPSQTFVDLETEIRMASEMLKKTRGTELPGHFSPDRIAKLFWEISEPWYHIGEKHIEQVFVCCREYFMAVTQPLFEKTGKNTHLHGGKLSDGFDNAEKVAHNYAQRHIMPELEKAREMARKELFRLEQDRRDWPKNLDKRFLVDKKNHRQRTEFRYTTRVMRDRLENGDNDGLDPDLLAVTRGLSRPQDYQDHNAEEFLNDMQSHYLIARDIFINNVATQVIERHFMREIQTLIPDDLDEGRIQDLVKEDDESARKTAEDRKEKERFEEALETLKQFLRV